MNINEHQQWFYSTGDGEKHGPVSVEQIQELAISYKLPKETTVLWAEGLSDWVNIENITGLTANDEAIVDASSTQRVPNAPVTPHVVVHEESASVYPSFFARLGAFLIDMVICNLGIVVLALVVGIGSEQMLNLIGILIVWLYFSLQESSAAQATLGKKWLGMKVCDDEGNKLSFLHATGRHAGKLLSSILLIGFIMAAFTEKKQGLHDIMAKTFVVSK
ncbi:RDD family protein [Glaciecola sp. MF2-115]|uniref:RDD family protein n=1 Tax=Glaciecola sp. MF2-115 TaxID=3384827 RepID=UPI0039A0E0B6